MTLYRNETNRIGLTKLAYQLLDEGDFKNGEQLLRIARKISTMTLSSKVPEYSVLRSFDLLMSDLKIPYCLIGGMAVNVHARPRGTDDIDVLVKKLPSEQVTLDRQYMRKFGFYPAKSRTGDHLILDKDNGMVECLLANNFLRVAALAASRKSNVMGMQIKVVSPSFLIGLKVAAIRSNKKRREKDSQDILAVYLNKKPDLTRMKVWLDAEEREILNQILPGKIHL